MEKRTILAIGLCLLVLFVYNAYMARFHKPSDVNKLAGSGATSEGTVLTRRPDVKEVLSDIPPAAETPLPHSSPSVEKETVIETDKFIITFTNIGGAIKKIELKDYPDAETGRPLTLAEATNHKHAIAGIEDLYIIPSASAVGYDLHADNMNVVYKHTAGDFIITKKYRLRNTFNHIELEITLQNLLNREINAAYKITGAYNIDDSGAFAARFIEANSKVNGRVVKDKKDSAHAGEISWVALKNKYFAIIKT